MPKKTRKSKSPKKSSLFTWPKFLVLLIPLFVGIFLIINGSQQNGVLGVSDLNLKNLTKVNKEHNPSLSPRPTGACKPIRIKSISFSSPCTDNKFGFQKADYVCADQTAGSITTTNCGNPEKVFEKIKKICNKNSTCKRPEVSKMPRPSISPRVSVTPTTAL